MNKEQKEAIIWCIAIAGMVLIFIFSALFMGNT